LRNVFDEGQVHTSFNEPAVSFQLTLMANCTEDSRGNKCVTVNRQYSGDSGAACCSGCSGTHVKRPISGRRWTFGANAADDARDGDAKISISINGDSRSQTET
jgi:hypothetical protein